MLENIPYCVVLDSNVWITERLLKTAMGEALLYSLTHAGARIGLPDLVEREVSYILKRDAEAAVEDLGKHVRFIGQMSGRKVHFPVPTSQVISEGIDDRWKALDGILHKIPFSREHAEAALDRIIKKLPPSAEKNNEQFRDCCIWEAAIDASAHCPVYLITNDGGFYEGRDRSRGLAASLVEAATSAGRDIRAFSSVKDFLADRGTSEAALNVDIINAAIVGALGDAVREKTFRAGESYQIGSAGQPKIKGYATPVASTVAISFEVAFPVKLMSDGNRWNDIVLTVHGTCSFDPKGNKVEDIEIRQWSKSVTNPTSTWYEGSMWQDPDELRRQFDPKRMRVIE